jgi:hypothetical protein
MISQMRGRHLRHIPRVKKMKNNGGAMSAGGENKLLVGKIENKMRICSVTFFMWEMLHKRFAW